MKYLLLFSFALITVFNIVVSAVAIKRQSFSLLQKVALVVVIWLLPVIGAGIVYAFLKSDDDPKGPDKPHFGGGHSGSVGESNSGSD